MRELELNWQVYKSDTLNGRFHIAKSTCNACTYVTIFISQMNTYNYNPIYHVLFA